MSSSRPSSKWRRCGGWASSPTQLRLRPSRATATHGAIYGSRLLNALLQTGVLSRTDAYERVKSLAQQALDTGRDLADLATADPVLSAHLEPAVLKECFDASFYLRRADEALHRL